MLTFAGTENPGSQDQPKKFAKMNLNFGQVKITMITLTCLTGQVSK